MATPLRHLVPFDNENQWSNLLAVLIERDPHVAAAAFDWPEAEIVGVLAGERTSEVGRSGEFTVGLALHLDVLREALESSRAE